MKILRYSCFIKQGQCIQFINLCMFMFWVLNKKYDITNKNCSCPCVVTTYLQRKLAYLCSPLHNH